MRQPVTSSPADADLCDDVKGSLEGTDAAGEEHGKRYGRIDVPARDAGARVHDRKDSAGQHIPTL